ncbi:hypothetical protein [Rhizobium leucaenae]|uniref:Uncharacterized protein n=1 Tax=Rhizobium leucaenae TaxID=29450 RepID=A0A7W7A042_9HYPH|nr:hypothetical protein [Rhizobium leucaenae]MBB4571497.1 hypothetical protein [Rhizobium leucaenae]MBB6304818.1 hypothetical protein [Rhizobium leucaenae]
MSVNCPICEAEAEEKLPRITGRIEIICPRCHRFGITASALAIVYHRLPEDRHAALCRARAIAEHDKATPLITTALVNPSNSSHFRWRKQSVVHVI